MLVSGIRLSCRKHLKELGNMSEGIGVLRDMFVI